MAISKREARRLAKIGMEMGARVWRGTLTVGSDGRVKIDDQDLAEWLTQHADAELILMAASIERITVDNELKSCYTCGRDYKGQTCPHCAQVRSRLRGD